jgi:DNA-directed RNA polymerase subunit E'/Rpb7
VRKFFAEELREALHFDFMDRINAEPATAARDYKSSLRVVLLSHVLNRLLILIGSCISVVNAGHLSIHNLISD